MTLSGIIHMRIRNGRKRYRVYSALSGEYVTAECSEHQVRQYMLDEAVKAVKREIDQAIANTSLRGTSLPFATGYELTGPWRDDERRHSMPHRFEMMPGGHRCSRCGDREGAAVHEEKRR